MRVHGKRGSLSHQVPGAGPPSKRRSDLASALYHCVCVCSRWVCALGVHGGTHWGSGYMRECIWRAQECPLPALLRPFPSVLSHLGTSPWIFSLTLSTLENNGQLSEFRMLCHLPPFLSFCHVVQMLPKSSCAYSATFFSVSLKVSQ